MDVTRDNFLEVLPVLLEKIATCKFMSFDEEMTGISLSDPSSRIRKDDTPQERYKRMRMVASRFGIIQFGLCLFHEVKGGLEASPYNFYLFPNEGSDVIMSASAVDFLRRNNMDFGTWINRGISFADAAREENLTKKYKSLVEDTANDGSPKQCIALSKQSDIDFLRRNMDGLKCMIEDDSKSEYTFENCNAFLRRVLYEQVEAAYPGNVSLRPNANKQLVAYRVSAEEMAKLQAQKKVEARENYQKNMGFRLVFNAITASGKPIVGHNCLYDIMFLLRWLHGPLPDTYEDFRTVLHTLLPQIYDTKYIAVDGIIGRDDKDTTLEAYYKRFVVNNADRVAISPASGFESILNDEQYHNAGYDAFITGSLFAQQSQVAGDISSTVNRTFMMASLYNMNLDPASPGGALKYTRHLYRLTGFPESVSTGDVLDAFWASIDQPAGANKDEAVEIIWVDNFSLFVDLVAPLKEKYELPQGWAVQKYADYVRNKEMKDEDADINEDVRSYCSLM